jgi:hypothetical protein
MRFLAVIAATLVLALAAPLQARAQDERGTALITAIDSRTRTLTLDTPGGPRTVVVAPAAGLRVGAQPLAWTDLAPGDAVAYQIIGGQVTRLEVARQFWAVPPDR